MQKLKNIYHLFQAAIANLIYGFPSRKLKVIGVTGTDGKTTTTHLIAHILKASGKKVSFVSSVFASIGGKESDIGFHVTTPSSFALQKLFKKSADNNDEYFVLETTSHALDQNRIWGIRYEIGVLTNVTHEHLDYHKTYEEYLAVKLKLLNKAKLSIVNQDDESYGLIKNLGLNVKIYNSQFKGSGDFKELTKFNKYNYSAAYTVCRELGIPEGEILKALKSFELPKGRLDLIYDKDFKIIIDFAHTPNALSQLLPEVRKIYLKKQGRLIHVFGSAGLRDFTKRPLMGEASAKSSDLIILTEEDYRSEDPVAICNEIAEGLEKEGATKVNYNQLINCSEKSYSMIINREKAIREAIKAAQKNDVIILTGKAHEKSLCRGKTEYPWDEYAAVEKALKNI
jgi:UDP-N-acetylmuramoyl-L-alanyl-D-glutamate--2,6-diaminopimelate ligase